MNRKVGWSGREEAFRSLGLIFLSSCSISLVACHRGSSAGEELAPSASVVTIGNTIGTCPDLASCEKECDAGSADRCRRLAATYAFGQGVDKDETRATALYVWNMNCSAPLA